MEIQLDREFVLHHVPRRPRNAHKGTFGTLLVLAGSRSYRGAAVLATSAALRSGAGLVRLASTEAVCNAAAATLPACILQPMKETAAGIIDPAGLPQALKPKHTAVLAGCGVTATPDTALWVLSLLKNTETPVVLDADALNILAGQLDEGENVKTRQTGLDILSGMSQPAVLTPHIGEMARLTGLAAEEVLAKPAETALQFAQENGCTVVLKSHESLVATPTGNLYVLRGQGNPGLAKGGSGDVLSGIIAGLLAQGFLPETAAAAGIWLHAEAAKKATGLYGEAGMSPADLPKLLGEVWRDLGR